jgi:hypothetical protein
MVDPGWGHRPRPAPDKARDHLFEAFQGGARKGGTGLGLAIAAELVRGHGGGLIWPAVTRRHRIRDPSAKGYCPARGVICPLHCPARKDTSPVIADP